MISLTVDTTTLDLPHDLYWSDEPWSPVAERRGRGLTGAQIRHVGVRHGGRPITLGAPPDGRGGWMRRALLDTLQTWHDTPDLVLELTLRGSTYSVRWRHEPNSPALTWTPLRHRIAPAGTDWVVPTLRLITVSSP